MEIFFEAGTWIALLTLTLLEIVLGIDNLIFISLVSKQLPEKQQPTARMIGLGLALLFRIVMILGITYIIQFDQDLFSMFGIGVTGREIILAVGGLFLIAKSTSEIHNKLDTAEKERKLKAAGAMLQVILQIVLLDII